MNIKSLKVVLVALALILASQTSLSEEMPVNPKIKAQQVEADLNYLLKESLKAAALEMDKDFEMGPFAFVKKADGTTGFFTPLPDTKQTVDEQISSIRAMLIDLARTKQILASVQSQYVRIIKDKKVAQQGITFEIEHVDGVSIMKFLPVSEVKDKNNKITSLNFQTDKLSTGNKLPVVFTRSIVR